MSGIRRLGVLAIVLVVTAGLAGTVGGVTAAGTEEEPTVTVTVDEPESVGAAHDLTVVVESTSSAGTVVVLNPEAVELTATTGADEAVSVGDGRLEFVDPTAGDSRYEIDVSLRERTEEAELEIAAWLDADERDAAADVDETSVTLPPAGSTGSVDIAVDDVERALVGDPVTVTANLTNDADEPRAVDLELLAHDEVVDETVATIEAGQSRTAVLTWTPATTDVGQRTLTVASPGAEASRTVDVAAADETDEQSSDDGTEEQSSVREEPDEASTDVVETDGVTTDESLATDDATPPDADAVDRRNGETTDDDLPAGDDSAEVDGTPGFGISLTIAVTLLYTALVGRRDGTD